MNNLRYYVNGNEVTQQEAAAEYGRQSAARGWHEAHSGDALDHLSRSEEGRDFVFEMSNYVVEIVA